ncbi:MAG: hypothetical protein M3280_01390, partial [Actinomycetota bacterium]|nr:hypothetical protein [Actinomycetota bacterium]
KRQKAKLLARKGRMEEGESLARSAMELVDRTDFLNMRGEVRLDLAEVLILSGRIDVVQPTIDEAIDLFRRKENTVMVRRASSLADAYRT